MTAAHLLERGFEIVDGQQYSDHFARFGARDVPIAEYRAALGRGLANPAQFHAGGVRPPLGAPSVEEAPVSTKPAQPASNGRNGNGKRSLRASNRAAPSTALRWCSSLALDLGLPHR